MASPRQSVLDVTGRAMATIGRAMDMDVSVMRSPHETGVVASARLRSSTSHQVMIGEAAIEDTQDATGLFVHVLEGMRRDLRQRVVADWIAEGDISTHVSCRPLEQCLGLLKGNEAEMRAFALQLASLLKRACAAAGSSELLDSVACELMSGVERLSK